MALEVRERPERSTMEITIDRDGSLFVAVPTGTRDQPILDFVDRKQDWIRRKLLEKAEFLPSAPPKQLVNGEGFRYLGRSYRLLRVIEQDLPVKLIGGRLRLCHGVDDGAAAIRSWYQRTGATWIAERLNRWAERCGVGDVQFDVRDLGYRWGSLSPGGRLNLHWAALQVRPNLIDYILVHELTHIGHPEHGPQFWAAVERAMPDHESRRQALALEGREVWLGETT
jgi:predicted metal-dependent hydrolase